MSSYTPKDSPKTVLCIDTSAEFCTTGIVAVPPSDGHKPPAHMTVIAQRQTPMTRGHAEHIMPHISQCLEQAQMTINHMDTVAVTVGPGAFTGIRIGLATAKGLCLPHKIPCVGVGVSGAYYAHAGGADTLILLETKRTDYYVTPCLGGVVQPDTTLDFDQIVTLLQDTPTLTLMGNGTDRFVAQWHAQYPHSPPPRVLPCPPALSVMDIAMNATTNPLPPLPVYVRSPHVQPPKSGIVKPGPV